MSANDRSSVHFRSSRRCGWKVAVGAALSFVLLLSGFAQRSSAAIIYVTTLEDGVGTGSCSLKEAVYSSILRTNQAISNYNNTFMENPFAPVYVTTQCVPGDGNDIIALPPGLVLQIGTPVNDQFNITGPTATPLITSTIVVEGYGATIQWVPQICTYNGGGFPKIVCPGAVPAFYATNFNLNPNVTAGPYTSRLFAVGSTGSLTIHNVYVKGFLAQGGSGLNGGGGGMGAGGAVYVQGGTLFVENSTFDSNGAVGGNGGGVGPGDTGGGGGGGGLGGFGGGDADQGGCGTLLAGEPKYPDSGGGGGGATGDGGWGDCGQGGGVGGYGGGTVFSGQYPSGTVAGFACGGYGGPLPSPSDLGSLGAGQPGEGAPCTGGGGGGGSWGLTGSGNGGNGNYGGGGGGGASQGGNGGHGGFGGGGGAGWAGAFGNTDGGDGGFGGGGGAGPNGYLVGNGSPGQGGGPYAGNADARHGGGGAGLGGAIFNDSGGVRVSNSTFVNNYVTRGVSGGGAADNGGDGGGAIFNINGHLTVTDVTIANNLSTGSGGGIVTIQTDPTASTILNLYDTIIYNNGSMVDGELTNAANECWVTAAGVGVSGAGNLVENNNGCDGVVTTGDPQLGPLQNNGGFTPTLAIPQTSAAYNAADANTSLSTDQRNDPRPEMGGYDIGAFELCIARNPNIVGECSGPGGIAPPYVPLTIQLSGAGQGTTSPAPGTYNEYEGSIVSLTATPALGFSFASWSGNVGNQQGAATPIVMLTPQTVTANFVLCNCVTDVTSSVAVTQGPIVLNPVTRRYTQTVTVTNTSGAPLSPSVSLILYDLSVFSSATLVNATGSTPFGSGVVSPYITSGPLGVGQTVSFSLQFSNPNNGAISYFPGVLVP
jgi:Divergent InlB B-repeat domain